MPTENQKNTHALLREQRIARLRHVIKTEGHELQNSILRERFPWSNDRMIWKIRTDLGIPAPGSDAGYLGRRDFAR